MLGAGMVSDFSKVTQLEINRTKIPIQGDMTSDSVFLTSTNMLPPIPMAFAVYQIKSVCPCPNCQVLV